MYQWYDNKKKDYVQSSDQYIIQLAMESEPEGLDICAIPGEKANSIWLILNEVYILHFNKKFNTGNSIWECRYRFTFDK